MAFDVEVDAEQQYADVMQQVADEVSATTRIWPPMNSAHEGFAVLKEEVDELWDEVRKNQRCRDLNEMKREAIQAAAMAVRFAAEVCSEHRGRK